MTMGNNDGPEMKILAFHSGHDAATAYLEDGCLKSMREVEKDNGIRHGMMSPLFLVQSMSEAGSPDVLAVSGWSGNRDIAGYLGVATETIIDRSIQLFGRRIRYFSSSHERSHILCSYGLSPFPQGQPCYCLLWEGFIGAFYYIDENMAIDCLGTVLPEPGHRYSFLYVLANSGDLQERGKIRLDEAGKLMALAGFGSSEAPTPEQEELIDLLLSCPKIQVDLKQKLKANPYCDIGVTNPKFTDLARHFSNSLYDRFYQFARSHLKARLPLLIAGGCGLNCEWNSRWLDCGLFDGLFVPPCVNDSGVALGTAIDARHFYTGKAKIEWSVYCGDEFVEDSAGDSNYSLQPLDLSVISRFLVEGKIVAWIQGRYEMGPRALGNRSLLASPLFIESRDRLNQIKYREPYRPIAPICMEDDMLNHFVPATPSPYMLHFHKVKHDRLPAVTHVDGSARVQSVNAQQNASMYDLLRSFKSETGFGVLCNTSLNFKGRGFINKTSDAMKYAESNNIEVVVINDKMLVSRRLQKG